jgi:hypothetical protein
MATGTITVQLDNALLMLLLEQSLKQIHSQFPLPIRHISVSTHDAAPIELRAGRSPITIRLLVTPTIDANGHVDLQIVQARLLGFFSVPAFVNRRLAEAINTRANALLQEMATQEIQGMHVHLVEIHTIEGALVATAEVSTTSPDAPVVVAPHDDNAGEL